MNESFLLVLLGSVSISLTVAANPADRNVLPTGDHYVSYSGTATARHSTQFIYGEQHVLRYRANRLTARVVLYTCRDGHPFARKTVSYVDPWAPDFLLDDAVNGFRQGVRTADKGRVVFFRRDSRQAEQSEPLPQSDNLVADAGFDEFIRAHWRALLSGDALALRFLVPSRLQAMSFQAQHVRSTIWEGIPVEVFHLKVSGALGWLLPSIEVSYTALDQTLVHYEGLADLRDASGENYRADIAFRPSDRALSDVAHDLAARQVHLAACT